MSHSTNAHLVYLHILRITRNKLGTVETKLSLAVLAFLINTQLLTNTGFIGNICPPNLVDLKKILF